MAQTFASLPFAVLFYALLIVHIVAGGLFLIRLCDCRWPDVWTQLCAVLAGGLAVCGHVLLLLGHFHVLHRTTFGITGFLALLYVWKTWPRKQWQTLRDEVSVQLREDQVLVWSVLLLLAIVYVSGLRPWQLSGAGDEQGYHWAAPLFWASHGGWETSPYKLTNSFAFVQVLYTYSAVTSSHIASHWTHSLFLVVLMLACASLATSLGARPVPALAASLACPVAVIQSSVSYNDVATAAFIASAFAVLFQTLEPKSDENGNEGHDNAGFRVLAGLFFACALATKPMSGVALPVALIFVFVYARKRRNIGREVAQFLLPIIGVIALWLLHAHAMTGRFWSNQGVILVRSPNDPYWLSGAATGRIPSWRDLVTLPTIPFVAPIWGNLEPLGGRTGLLLPFALWGIWMARGLETARRKVAWWLLAAAVSYFFLLGAIAVKTRFHIWVWMSLGVFAALAFSQLTRKHIMDAKTQIALVAFYILLWASMFGDSARVLLRNVEKLP